MRNNRRIDRIINTLKKYNEHGDLSDLVTARMELEQVVIETQNKVSQSMEGWDNCN